MTFTGLRALVAVGLVAVASAAPAAATPPPPCATDLPGAGRWMVVAPPPFARDGEPTVARVDPRAPRSAAMSDGRDVFVTTDLGCSWHRVLSFAAGAVTDPRREVVDVEFTGLRDPAVVALAHRAEPTGTDIVELYAGGARGLEPLALPEIAGIPVDVAVAPSDGRTMYLLARGGGRPTASPVRLASGASMWATADAGRTWDRRVGVDQQVRVVVDLPVSGPVDPVDSGGEPTAADGRSGLAVDPLRPRSVVAWGQEGIARSDDGGRSWSDAAFDRATSVAIAHREGALPAVVASVTGQPWFLHSPRHGQTDLARVRPVSPVGQLGTVTAATVGGPRDEVVIASAAGVFFRPAVGYGAGYFFSTRAPHDVRGDLRAFDARGRLAVAARSGAGLMIGVPAGPVPPPGTGMETLPPIGLPGDVRLPPGVETANSSAELLPHRLVRTLREGATSDERYLLTLPQRRAVDVFFLVDISDSMKDEIDGLRNGLGRIVTELTDAGVDAHFGVGEYRSYDNDPAYRLVRDVGPPGPGLAAALNQLVHGGGGSETQLAALYQVATGEGQNEGDAVIPPGQEAHFRPGSLPVIVHATDEGLSEGAPNPSYDRVAEALNRKRIEHVGLAFEALTEPGTEPEFGQLPTEPPSAGLARVSRGTGTLAPATGADCDGDGDVDAADVPPSEPLVCKIAPSRSAQVGVMARAIVNLLLAVRDEATVELGAYRDGDVVGDVFPRVVTDVDLSSSHALPFNVRYVCPAGRASERAHVLLIATARGRAIASSTAAVRCVPTEATVVPPPFVPRQPAIVFEGYQPPNPQVETFGQTQAQSQTQSQSQSQAQAEANAQGALSPEDEEQVQVALGHQGGTRDQADSELAFAARPPLPDMAHALQVAAAMATAFAFAVASRRRAAAGLTVRAARARNRWSR